MKKKKNVYFSLSVLIFSELDGTLLLPESLHWFQMGARPFGMVKCHKLGHIFSNLFINIFSALESHLVRFLRL